MEARRRLENHRVATVTIMVTLSLAGVLLLLGSPGAIGVTDALQTTDTLDGEEITDDTPQGTQEPNGPVTTKLAPLYNVHGPVDPLPVPSMGLYEATVMHPKMGAQDLLHVESLQPLPPELDRALGTIVAAHGIATTYLNTQQGTPTDGPPASLVAQTTLALALDKAWPVLEHYEDAPVGYTAPHQTDRAPPPEPVPTGQALMDLYQALGLEDDVLKALEAPAQAAASALPPAMEEPLSMLLVAIADYNEAALETLSYMNDPPSEALSPIPLTHDLDELEGLAQQSDETFEDTPLEDLTEATEDVFAALEAARDAMEQTPASELPANVWMDPLGLIVIGSNGCDVFDATPRAVDCGELENATIHPPGATGPLPSGPGAQQALHTPAVDLPWMPEIQVDVAASLNATTAGLGQEARPGWHMLVLDPGRDDVYFNNAGGIDAGAVQVEVELSAGGVDSVRTVFVDSNENDWVCLPSTDRCMFRFQPQLASVLTSLGDPGVEGGAQPAIGIPLAALVLDMDGDDTYTAPFDFAQGAARGIGVGALVSMAGDDAFHATHWAQGASDAYGTAALLNLGGDDAYHATAQAQGFAHLPTPGLRADDNAKQTIGDGMGGCGMIGQFAPSLDQTLNQMFVGNQNYRDDPDDDGIQESGWTQEACIDGLGFYFLRHARALFADVQGANTYAIEDLGSGQGTAKMHDDLVRYLAWMRAVHPDLVSAAFLDLGIGNELPVPEGPYSTPTTMTPGEDGADLGTQAWMHRLIERDAATGWYKTAVNVHGSTEESPACNPEQADTFPPGFPFALHDDGCNFGPHLTGSLDTGESGHASGLFCPMSPESPWSPFTGCAPDPFGPSGYTAPLPDLAPSFNNMERTYPVDILVSDASCISQIIAASVPGSNTQANCSKAKHASGSQDQPEEDPTDEGRTLLIGSPPVVEDPPPLTLIFATSGREDTTYLGNITTDIWFSSDRADGEGSLAQLLVDLGGQDTYIAGDEANPSGDRALAHTSTLGNAILLVDRGGATMQAGNQTVAYSSGGTSIGGSSIVLAMDGNMDIQTGSESQAYAEGSLSLLHLGDDGAGPSTLVAGDRSQAVSTLGVALLVGSPADNTYRVDGQGMGLCDGGIAAFIEQGGDNAYELGSPHGFGECPSSQGDGQEDGDFTIFQPGPFAFFLDARADDAYAWETWPPREGPIERSQDPGDDRVWATGAPSSAAMEDERNTPVGTVGEINHTLAASGSLPWSPVGLGVDNVRNLHHAIAEFCRGDACDVSLHTSLATGEEESSEDTSLSSLVRSVFYPDLPGLGEPRNLTIHVGEPPGEEPASSGEEPCQDVEPLDEHEMLQTSDPETRMLCFIPETSSNLQVPARWGQDIDQLQTLENMGWAACNCSVRLTITPEHNAQTHLASAQTSTGVATLPSRGALTTLEDTPDPWFEGWDGMQAPAPRAAQDEEGRTFFTVAERGGQVLLDPQALPTTLATVTMTMELWDPIAEETGGLVPPAVGSWTGSIVEPAPVTTVQAVTLDDDWALALTAQGPLDASTTVTPINLTGDENKLGDPIRVEDRMGGTIIDLPNLLGDAALAANGEQACLAILASNLDDEGGYCWTGQTLVTLVPMSEDQDAPPDKIQTITSTGLDVLNVTLADLPEEDLTPHVKGASPEAHEITNWDGTQLATLGVPGSAVEGGNAWIRDLLALEDHDPGQWATVTIATEGAGWATIDEGSVTLYTGAQRPFPTASHDRCGTSHHWDPLLPDPQEEHYETRYPGNDGPNEGADSDYRTWSPFEDSEEYPHEEQFRWRPTVLCGELLPPTEEIPAPSWNDTDESWEYEFEEVTAIEEHDLTCHWAQRLTFTQLRMTAYEMQEPGCILEPTDEGINLHVRVRDTLETAQSTHSDLIEWDEDLPREDAPFYQGDAFLLTMNGSIVSSTGETLPLPGLDPDDDEKTLGVHIVTDTHAPEATFSPLESIEPTTHATVQLPGTPYPGMLRTDESSTVDAYLEARNLDDEDGEWARVASFDVDALTEGETKRVNLTPVIEGNRSNLALRAGFIDESQNEALTTPRAFLYDASPAGIEEANLTQGPEGDVLVIQPDQRVTALRCQDNPCSIEPVSNPLDERLRPTLEEDEAEIGLSDVLIPVNDLVWGLEYELRLTMEDELGNTGTAFATFQTPQPISIDATAMQDALLNRTATLAWDAAITPDAPKSAAQVMTSAWIETQDTRCSLLDEHPSLETGTPEEPTPRNIGPIALDCGLDEAAKATLNLLGHAPAESWVTHEAVPVTVDAHAPRTHIEAPEGWTNEPAHVQISTEDAMNTTVTATLNGFSTPLETIGNDTHQLHVAQSGEHRLEVTATDQSGNANETVIPLKLDPRQPTLTAAYVGGSQELAILEVRMQDDLSGPDKVQATLGDESTPWLPSPRSESVLVPLPRTSDADTARVTGVDKAGNTVHALVDTGNVTHVDDDSNPELHVLNPSTIEATFTTHNATSPTVIVEDGAERIHRTVLPEAQQHEAVIEPLRPGANVTVTVLVSNEAQQVPVGQASITLPADEEPPERVPNLEAHRDEHGVVLTWDQPTDDVGVETVIIERDGERFQTSSDRYWDTSAPKEATVYNVHAVDLAGNAGLTERVTAPAYHDVNVENVTIEPRTALPGDPISVTAHIHSNPHGQADLVVLETWDGEVVLDPKTPLGESVLYGATLKAPPLDVGTEDPTFKLLVHIGEDTFEVDVDPPTVAALESDELSPVPFAPLAILAATVLIAARAQRRWSA